MENSEFWKNIMKFLKINPLTGLPYVFLYTCIVKGFFMILIYLCGYCIIHMNKIDSSFYEKMISKNIRNKTHYIINYKTWGRDPYFIFY